jgi:hypothetical protein
MIFYIRLVFIRVGWFVLCGVRLRKFFRIGGLSFRILGCLFGVIFRKVGCGRDLTICGVVLTWIIKN